MEVFSVFTSKSELISAFVRYVLEYENIILDGKDNDTKYLIFKDNKLSRIYLHVNTEYDEEIKSNFEEDEIKFINKYFINKKVYMIDISFNDVMRLNELLVNFTLEIAKRNDIEHHSFLFFSPFDGFITINGIGTT